MDSYSCTSAGSMWSSHEPSSTQPCHGLRTVFKLGPGMLDAGTNTSIFVFQRASWLLGPLGWNLPREQLRPHCFVLALSQVQIKLDFGFFPHERTAPLMRSFALWRTAISLVSKLTGFTPLAATHTASFPKESKIHGPKLEASLPFRLIVKLPSEHQLVSVSQQSQCTQPALFTLRICLSLSDSRSFLRMPVSPDRSDMSAFHVSIIHEAY